MYIFNPSANQTPLHIACILLCGVSRALCAGPFLFKDVTPQTGIIFRHHNGSSGKLHIIETVTAGLALLDYDADGDVDIYFVSGAYHDGTTVDAPPRNALYRNDGKFQFTDVTSAAGVGDTGFGLGVAVADYDNDGDADIYVNNHGPNVLYRNNGDGTFTDVTAHAGVSNGSRMGAGANFLDADGDGDLDLYVSNYVKCLTHGNYGSTRGGYPAYLGPAASIYADTPDVLYRNNGDGTFTDVSNDAGIDEHVGAGMGTICGDIDNDRDTDIIVANDMGGNFLLINDGRGHFEETGLIAGMAFDDNGEAQGSMGTELGDYDNDGLLDLYITSFQSQLATLYRNLGDGEFEDVTTQTGAGAGTIPLVTWGSGLVDFDHDGDRDLFVACGHLQPNVEAYDGRTSYYQLNRLYANDGQGRFLDVSDQSGDGLQVRLSSRGAGFDDLDDDGDVDVVILNSTTEPTLLRNDTPNQGHWLQVLLRGTRTNREGVGAQVRVHAGGLVLLDEVHSGRGYQSHYGTRLHFGLGERTQIDRIEVAWIGGQTDVYRNVRVDQRILLEEGRSEPSPLDRSP